MDAFILSPSSFSILFLLTIFQLSYARDDFHFTSCPPFDCGSLSSVSYPFWTDQYNRPSYCGYGNEGYKLKCRQNQSPVMTLSSQEFYVLHLNRSHGLLTIKRVELNNTCPQTILINNAFNYTETAENITLEQVEIPIGKKAFDDLIGGISTVNESLLEPFDIKYFAYDDYCKECEDSGGRCGYKQTETSLFACYCRDHPHTTKCHEGGSGSNLGRKLAIGNILPSFF
ncbi:LEAF RUST 10 DISEASE-RESISTANCE LOCUS RECEPTOR-LIKE PROTEIN KINASE-like 1.2 isoform X1 [Gossypium australe]|uniref:non-specific serine/threonine protein kinase n=1 Tax=Gossypium australe TaxID=47621 RepID=A0A5B6UEY1_9ROSI|nr:LEAF RUST 10 DISEASE-RESISTANCE LOCUS RECEPTOR-LIKE PROTEIN KINASE-like 1.2 isoform X1 [Gossypium australe]